MEIQIFSNSKFGQLRVAMNEKGETVFCLVDVCKALAIGNTSDVKRRLDGAAIDTIEVCLTSVNQYGAKSVRTTKMTYIGEPNLDTIISRRMNTNALCRVHSTSLAKV